MEKRSHQLMLNDHGEPVVALLHHSLGKQPTDVINTCRISKGDTFVLAEDCGEIEAGEEITFDSTFLYNVGFHDKHGNRAWADAEFSTSSAYATDMDDRRMYFTKYHFKIKQAAIVQHKARWWHLFYSIDMGCAVVAEVGHIVGQKTRADYVNYIQYPKLGDVFQLGYRFKDFPVGTNLAYLGTEDRQLKLQGPDGKEFKHSYIHQEHGREDGDGYSYFGPLFTGAQIVLTDQERYPAKGKSQ